MRTTPMAPSSTPNEPRHFESLDDVHSRYIRRLHASGCGAPQWQYTDVCVGAQAQTRSNILKAGTGFDAQKQFLANVEDAIASPVDIPASIKHYQKTLQYASTPLDFVFGLGLYLAPSDMALHPGNVQGYNNEIVIAGSEAAIGHNPGINESEQISGTGDKSFEGKIAAPAGTDHKRPPSGRPAADPSGHADPAGQQNTRLVARPRRTTKTKKRLS